MKGRAINYSPKELDWIEAHSTEPRENMHAEFVRKFGRTDVSKTNINSLCKRKGWMTGRTGCFEKGMTSHNKGKKGFCPPGCEKGWFKKGERKGVAIKLYKPIGTERVSKDGYLERKVNDDMPLQQRWRAVHLIRWEEANGPIPEGYALKCLDGDKTNTAPENWIAVPRSMLPRLAGAKVGVNFDLAEPELKPAILAAAMLEQKAREIKSAHRGQIGDA